VILDTNALSAVAADEPAVVRVYPQAASMEPRDCARRISFRYRAIETAALKKAGRPLPSNVPLDRCTLPATPATTPKHVRLTLTGTKPRAQQITIIV
jgi:hypothetical protein